MTKYIEALGGYDKDKGLGASIFMAGGITNCPDWQKDVLELLSDVDGLVLLNPRRVNFPIDDPNASQDQIEWEHKNLNDADAIMFWFPKETLCPIVLYELGAWSKTTKPLFVGVHPEYKRKQDVEIQTRLARPDVNVTYSIEEMAKSIKDYLGEK